MSFVDTRLRSTRDHSTSRKNGQTTEELDKGQDDLTVRSGTVGVHKNVHQHDRGAVCQGFTNFWSRFIHGFVKTSRTLLKKDARVKILDMILRKTCD